MIDKVEIIKNIGAFDEFKWVDDIEPFSKINIVYGYNGSGKTTLSNSFYLMSGVEKEDKGKFFKEISGGEDSAISIIENNTKIIYPDVCRNPLYVFNSHFVETHVYHGSATSIKEFDKNVVTSDQLKNPVIKYIEDEITKEEGVLKNIESEENGIKNKFEDIQKTYKGDFNEKVAGSRLTNWSIPETTPVGDIDNLRERLNTKYHEYELSLKQDEIRIDIDIISRVNLTKIDINIDEIKSSLNLDISTEGRGAVEKKLEKLKTNKLLHGATHSDWLENAHELLKTSKNESNIKCPVCDTEISGTINTLLEQYDSYFNERYSELSEKLSRYEDAVININGLVVKNHENELQLISLENKYEKDKLDKIKDCLTENFQEEIDWLNGLLLKKRCNLKYKINDQQDEKKLEEIQAKINIYNKLVDGVVKRSGNIKTRLSGMTLDRASIINEIKETIKQLGNLEFDSIVTDGAVKKRNDLEEKYIITKKAVGELRNKLSSEIAKLKSESRYINQYLKRLGIHHFEIDIDRAKDEDNILVRFSVGVDKRTIHNCLSEGEKTSLALAYFFSKIQYEVFDNTKFELSNAVLVIDDPVSSLDENKLFSTAYLIYKLFSTAGQLFLLSHNLVFLKFVGGLFSVSDRNCMCYLIR